MDEDAKIDHVGIAVESVEAAEPLFRALLGGPEAREEIEDEGVRVSVFGRGSGRVELLEPSRPDSTVARFLDRGGPGLHHVCLRVEAIEDALRRAEREGAEAIPPRVRTGAGGRRVAFLHPRSTGGVLVELSEVPGGGTGRKDGRPPEDA